MRYSRSPGLAAREKELTDFIIVIHPAEEGGFWAEVPALEGCFAQGESIEDVIDDAREAIASHLGALREAGEPASAATGVIVATVSVAA